MSGEEIISKYKVAMCVGASDTVATFWAHDYARMMVWTNTIAPELKQSQVFCTGSLIPKQRNTILKTVIEDGRFTHALFVDTDMRFPRDTLLRLLSHDVEAVGVNYTKRNAPFDPVAFGLDYAPIYTEPESEGLVQVGGIGFGIVLLQIAPIKTMKQPYFTIGFDPKEHVYLGEDYYFCQRLTEMKIPIWCDQDLSKEIAHSGRLELTYEHALKQRAARVPESPKVEG